MKIDPNVYDEEGNVIKKQDLPNHGRGRCNKVTVVFKINMESGTREFFCVAQNPTVAIGIREQHVDEAKKYGIDPKYYISFEDAPVVWSRAVFPTLYRIWDTDRNRTVWGGENTKNKDGYYIRRKSALNKAEKLKEKGELNNYIIEVYNRQRKRWEVSFASSRKSKLKSFNRYNPGN